MTVAELITKLNGVDPDRIVILQKDGEGNGYSPLSDIDDNAMYEADTTYSGDVGLQRLTPELKNQGYTAADKGGGVPCLVLYPID